MTTNRTTARVTTLLFMLSILQRALANPVPRIVTPDIGSLSFVELVVRTFQRILDLGFLQGVVSSLLVLGCLVCLLICGLCTLAAYMQHTEAGEMYENVGISESGQLYFSRHEERGRISNLSHTHPQNRSRVSRYLLSKHASPVTKISIHTSSSCRRTNAPSTPPSKASRTYSPSRSLSPPLRSALSKSPSPARRRHALSFGSQKARPTSSPKSVRWADEIQVSVITTLEMDIQMSEKVAGIEMDIGLSKYEGAFGVAASTDVPPAYNAAASDTVSSSESEKCLAA